jgi:hypothetical protein
MSTSGQPGAGDVRNKRTAERIDRLGGQEMLPLYRDPHYTFRFAEDRIIPRFHLEGVQAGVRVSVFKMDPTTGERQDLLATATVGEGGWVELEAPIIVRTGEAFIVVPERAG